MDDALAVLELTNFCLGATNDRASVDTIAEHLHKLLAFDSAIIGSGDVNGERILTVNAIYSNGHNPWLQAYTENRLDRIDPIVRRALHDHRSFRWSDAYVSHVCQNQQYRELKHGYGVREGLAAAYHAPQRGPLTTLISLSGAERHFGPREGKLIEHILPHVHEVVSRQSASVVELSLPSLTPRETEILKWIREGKSSWDIGLLLSISERTVKFHTANTFAKLGVTTRAQAVARALHLRLIPL